MHFQGWELLKITVGFFVLELKFEFKLLFFFRNFKINSPKKVQIISIEIMNLAGRITEILNVLEEYMLPNSPKWKIYFKG